MAEWTDEEIAAVRARIAQFAGVKETRFADQSTTFDMEGALKFLEKMESTSAVSRTRLAATRKGV
jgi:hypothetical protein